MLLVKLELFLHFKEISLLKGIRGKNGRWWVGS